MSLGVWVILAGQSENDFTLSDRIAYEGYFGRSKFIPIGSLFSASNWARFVSSNDAADWSVLSGTLVLPEERKTDVDGIVDEFESEDDGTFCAESPVVLVSSWLSVRRVLFVELSRWNCKWRFRCSSKQILLLFISCMYTKHTQCSYFINMNIHLISKWYKKIFTVSPVIWISSNMPPSLATEDSRGIGILFDRRLIKLVGIKTINVSNEVMLQ